MVSVATASLHLGMLKTGLRDLKCFLMKSWVCGAVPCLVVTLKVPLMLDGDVHAKNQCRAFQSGSWGEL